MATSVISTLFLAWNAEGVLEATVSPYPDVVRFVVDGAGQVNPETGKSGAAELDLVLKQVHLDNHARATLHGFVQKVSDRAAKKCDPKTGKPAPVGEKFLAMKTLVEHLNSGSADWSLRAVAQPRVDWEVEDLVQAMKDLGYVGSDAAEGKIRGWKPAERAQVSLQDDIRERINELRAERAKMAGGGGEAVAALLAGLGAE